jgi:transmembrane 9 superfamily member 2/4
MELPYDYYSLPFCKPKGGVQMSKSSVTPGNILSGLRIFNSPYVFNTMVRFFELRSLGNTAKLKDPQHNMSWLRA